MMELPELLAPAGDLDSLKAAIQNGADAVYLGGKDFSARASAANFDRDELVQAVEYCHLYGAFLYVTVNTLILPEEMAAAEEYLAFLNAIGVDGVIVQDLGLARLVRQAFPELPLHGSTQMTVHNQGDLEVLTRLGFSRVIAARELTIDEISAMVQASPLDIEVFVHGALCISYSGQCLFSSLVGGRSGNRGRCAQPCRLQYELVDDRGRSLAKGQTGKHLLSTRDLKLLRQLPLLVESGVKALKIEGRMRRPEYVAVVTATYRKALDSLARGEFVVSEGEELDLAQVFNRGFTTGHLLGRRLKGLIGAERPNNRGILLGRVVSFDGQRALINLTRELHVGDEVEVWVSDGGRVAAEIQRIELEKGREPVDSAPSGSRVFVALKGPIRPSDRVFRLSDRELLSRARSTFRSPRVVRKIPVRVSVRVREGEPFRVVMEDGQGHRGTGISDALGERALKHPLTREKIQEHVCRLGNEPFEADDVKIDLAGDVMVPFSEMNKARSRAVDDLSRQRIARKPRPALPASSPQPGGTFRGRPRLAVHVAEGDAARAAAEAGADLIYFGGEAFGPKKGRAAWESQWEGLAQAAKLPVPVYWALPRITRADEMELVQEGLQVARELNLKGVLVGNLGTLALAVESLPGQEVVADFSLNVYNGYAIQVLKELGASRVTLSPELTFAQVGEVRSFGPSECIIHGRLPVMITDYCILGDLLGREDSCNYACRKRYGLKDRLGLIFPLEVDQACRMHVLNSKVLCLIEHLDRFNSLGVGVLRIMARREGPDKVAGITAAYRSALDDPAAGKSWSNNLPYPASERTTGHYFRGVL
ncbi:MAG: peptidase U32 [Firmicutes bacterium]|nr:peptidase U32 [Bacillota bacterium]